jgi:hypothetical protein
MRYGTTAFFSFVTVLTLSSPLLAEKVKTETVIVSRSGEARLCAQSPAGAPLSGALRRARIHLALPGYRPA